MKVFKFKSGDHFYGYSGETEEEAKALLFEDFGEMPVDSVEEISESKWDERNIDIYEDNDLSCHPFKVSIREAMLIEPGLLFSNDYSYL